VTKSPRTICTLFGRGVGRSRGSDGTAEFLITDLTDLAEATIETLLAVHFELNRLSMNAPLRRSKTATASRLAGGRAAPVRSFVDLYRMFARL
jgi:hypothetical protein